MRTHANTPAPVSAPAREADTIGIGGVFACYVPHMTAAFSHDVNPFQPAQSLC